MKWITSDTESLKLYGFPFYETERLFRRLQKNPPETLPAPVNGMSDNTTGGQLRFTAKLKQLSVKVKLTFKPNMQHMPPTGQCGFDCYIGVGGKEPLYYSTAFPNLDCDEYESTLINFPESKKVDITLNFPLYCGVKTLEVGFDDEAELFAPPPFESGRIVVYGGSIDQGGCANRPGMAYTNILSRWLNTEFINLGYSGNGKAEAEVAAAIAQIKDVKMFIINTTGNCPDAKWLVEHMPRFLEILREANPEVPILIWQLADFPGERIIPNAVLTAKRAVEEAVYYSRLALGDKNIYIRRMDYTADFMGHDITWEVTVDGCHPTDYGFMLTAMKLYPIIKKILR